MPDESSEIKKWLEREREADEALDYEFTDYCRRQLLKVVAEGERLRNRDYRNKKN